LAERPGARPHAPARNPRPHAWQRRGSGRDLLGFFPAVPIGNRWCADR